MTLTFDWRRKDKITKKTTTDRGTSKYLRWNKVNKWWGCRVYREEGEEMKSSMLGVREAFQA